MTIDRRGRGPTPPTTTRTGGAGPVTDQDEESLAEWLFFARKHRRRRATHTTRTINTNTQENE